ncbi:MAG: hypothetical protein MSS99_01165, partial [Bacteroidales bacterium]|nr:hypothetical protein [Bacteroidales bacterium]
LSFPIPKKTIHDCKRSYHFAKILLLCFMAKFRLEFSALSIAKLKQNKTPFRSTKAAFWKNETAFGECPNAVLF